MGNSADQTCVVADVDVDSLLRDSARSDISRIAKLFLLPGAAVARSPGFFLPGSRDLM
jgi:hypothetical protein